MDTIERLISVADLYIEATGTRPSTASLHALGHSRKLHALRNGRDIQVRFADAAFQWFAINWPEEEPLPAILSEWCAANFAAGVQRRAAS